MKPNLIYRIIPVIALLFFFFQSESQVSIEANNSANSANDYVGWDNTETDPLVIAHKAAYDIDFQTAGTQRMTILGPAGSTQGFVGIGTASPSRLLELSNSASSYTPQFKISNTNTNANYTEFYVQSQGNLIINPQDYQSSAQKIGMGPFGTTNPQSRFEVFDDSGTPQLRLSYSISGTQYYTTFKTDGSGYLTVNPSHYRMGINIAPTEALDINPNTGDNPLRLRSLGTSSNSDFLVVNSNGVVTKRSISNIVNECSATTQNMVPKFCSTTTSIQNSQIFDNGTNVGVNTTSPDVNFLMDLEPGSLNNGLIINTKFTGAVVNLTGSTATTTPYPTGIGISNTVTNTGSNSTNYGFSANVSGCTTANIAVYGTGSGGSSSAGGFFLANGATTNTGVYGQVSGSTGTTNYAVYGLVNATVNNSTNFGLYGAASHNATNCTDYGVYGTATGGSGSTDYAGYFSGNLYATTYLNLPSDENLKSNIEPVADALSLVSQLNPVSYNYNTLDFPQMNLPSDLQYGFLAQEVEQIFPAMVGDATQPALLDESGNEIEPSVSFKTVQVGELLPIAIQAIKELQTQVNDLQSQLDLCCEGGMRQMNDEGRNPFEQNENHAQITLENLNWVSLSDAVPNPFDERTTISYNIPDEFSSAQVIFYNNNGQVIKSFDISVKGVGSLDVYATNLSDGVYSYSLFVDGKLIDSKKMVKQ